MRIEIDYNGSTAVCTVNGKNFNKCSPAERVFAMGAFITIENDHKRAVKHEGRKNLSQEDVFVC